jgi:hypothetical protein
MSTINLAGGQIFHEIFGVGTEFPRLERRFTADANDGGAEYWTQGGSCPEIAHKLSAAVSTTIGQRFDTKLNALRILLKATPSCRVLNYFDTRATLLFCPTDNDELLQVPRMRSEAACLLAGLQRPSRAGQFANPTFLLQGEEATLPEMLMKLPTAKLLGIRITEDLVGCVPGRADIINFKSKFRDAPRQPMVEDTFEVRGRMLSTKSGGRYHAVGIAGLLANGRDGEFKQPKVLYAEELREAIARAVSEPWRRLLMSITRTSVPCGRAQPQLTFTLNSLRFEQ